MWVDLKSWLIGYQRGYKYDARVYRLDSSSSGIKAKTEKLKLALGASNCSY